MRFIYTRHVNLRIEQRSLSRRKIENTIKHPEKIIPSFGNRSVAQKSFGPDILEVVYKRSGKTVIVITAYWFGEEI